MGAVLVDSCVIFDVLTDDAIWGEWSENALIKVGDEAQLVINPLIFAEISVGFERIEDLDESLPLSMFRRDPLPWEAAFLAGKAFFTYRRAGGVKSAPLPDFYIGAHAAVADFRLLTRDSARFRTYFPTVDLIAPGNGGP